MKLRLITATMLFVAAVMAGQSALSLDVGAQVSGEKSAHGSAAMHPAGDHTRGEELYNASCIVCHGAQATGGIGPRLAGNPVLSNDQAFGKILSEGRHMMPPLKDAVTAQQLADIRAWLKTLR